MIIRGLIRLLKRFRTHESRPRTFAREQPAETRTVQRPEILSGIFYLRRALHFWHLIFLSFAADIIVFALARSVPRSGLESLPITTTLIIAVCIAILGTMRNQAIEFSDWLHRLQFKLAGSKLVLPLLIFATIVPLGELLLKVGQVGERSVFIILAVVLGGGFSIYRQLQARNQQTQQYEHDAVSRIEELNKQNFIISTVPLICARSVGILGALSAAIADAPITELVLYQALAIILMGNLKPATDQFITRCTKCAGWASRPFRYYHCCPNCSTDFSTDKTKALRERLSTAGKFSSESVRRRPLCGPAQRQAKKPRRFFELVVSRPGSSKRSAEPSTLATAELSKPFKGKG